MSFNESDTRAKLIDPALHERGWREDWIRRELTPGPFVRTGAGYERGPGRADYVLHLPIQGQAVPIAVVEAKAEDAPPDAGIEQAKRDARLHGVPFAFASNGHQFHETDLRTNATRGPLPMRGFPKWETLRDRWCRGMERVGGWHALSYGRHPSDVRDNAHRFARRRLTPLHPLNSPARQNIVARLPIIAVVHARMNRKYAPLGQPNSPHGSARSIQIQDDSVSVSAGAVEHQPLAMRRGCNEVCATGIDVYRHIVYVGNGGFKSPKAWRQPLGQRVLVTQPCGNQPPQRAEQRKEFRLHAGHTCSRNGSVHPRPSFPLPGWQ